VSFIQKVILTFSILFLVYGMFYFNFFQKEKKVAQSTPTINAGKVKYPVDYLIVMVGDSMTETLGNSDELRANLKNYYPKKTFDILNYGFGSTNILTLNQRLKEKTFHSREFIAITDIDFDLILIESFGHNPLSELPLEQGLKKQTEALEEAVKVIHEKNPKAKIVFVATIAPSRQNYGRGQVELSDIERRNWAKEREEYIKNHIQFARSHNIPVVNIFEKSVDKNGDLFLDYVNSENYIHPSPTGVIFISKEIADFIFQQKIL